MKNLVKNVVLITFFMSFIPLSYSQENVEEVIIDSGASKGISQPIIVHSKNKSKSEKTSAA